MAASQFHHGHHPGTPLCLMPIEKNQSGHELLTKKDYKPVAVYGFDSSPLLQNFTESSKSVTLVLHFMHIIKSLYGQIYVQQPSVKQICSVYPRQNYQSQFPPVSLVFVVS